MEFCERKKKEENERWERMVKKMKTESQVWKIINRERKKRMSGTKDIELREWEEFFRRQLGGGGGMEGGARSLRGKGGR